MNIRSQFIIRAKEMQKLLLSGGQWSSHHHLSHSWCDEGFLCQYANPSLRQHPHVLVLGPSLWDGPCPSPLILGNNTPNHWGQSC